MICIIFHSSSSLLSLLELIVGSIIYLLSRHLSAQSGAVQYSIIFIDLCPYELLHVCLSLAAVPKETGRN